MTLPVVEGAVELPVVLSKKEVVVMPASTENVAVVDVDTVTEADMEGKSSEELTELGHAALDQGRTESAIQYFAKALQIKVEASGDELALENAPLFFNYGSALLQQCSQKSDVFGGAIKQAQQDKAAKIVKDVEGEDTVARAGASVSKAEATRPEVNDEEEEEEEEDDVDEDEDISNANDQTDLELAWEMLETSRVIYSKHAGVGKGSWSLQFGLADTYSNLGDLSFENDADGMPDYNFCLDILTGIESRDLTVKQQIATLRATAAIHFKMAIASNSADTAFSIRKLQDAKASITNCIRLVLGDAMPGVDSKHEASAAISIDAFRAVIAGLANEDEASCLIDVLQQIQEKIEDVTASEPIASAEISDMVQKLMADAAGSIQDTDDAVFPKAKAVSSSSAPAINNLGMIVGQKRKLQVTDASASAVEQPEAKKANASD